MFRNFVTCSNNLNQGAQLLRLKPHDSIPPTRLACLRSPGQRPAGYPCCEAADNPPRRLTLLKAADHVRKHGAGPGLRAAHFANAMFGKNSPRCGRPCILSEEHRSDRFTADVMERLTKEVPAITRATLPGISYGAAHLCREPAACAQRLEDARLCALRPSVPTP